MSVLTVVLAVAAAVAAASPGLAQTRAQALEALRSGDVEARRVATLRLGEVGTSSDLPALLALLRDDDELERSAAEFSIWKIWGRSGDAKIDALYAQGVDQMNDGRLQEGIATFTGIIRLKPDFAEAWNKRATLYFLAGDYQRSLADCDQVIKRNPSHFGALAGYGQIYLQLHEPAKALEYFKRALAVNPNMDGVRANIQGLERLLERQRGRMI